MTNNMIQDYEWSYFMRRNMQEVIPGLYLGPYSSAVKSSLPVLQQAGITHIVCVRHCAEAAFIKPQFADSFRYMIMDISDSKSENILRFFPIANKFIEDCLSNGGRCLVHGNGGISRSAAIVMAYVMQKLNLTYKGAYHLVQQRRFCIGPNEGFMAQLAEFEAIYPTSQMDASEMSRPKRKFQEVESDPDAHYPSLKVFHGVS